MISFRVIPVLLISQNGLVKTRRFKEPIYIGDPINAIKIFNEKEVDELILLDIDASKEGRGPDFSLIEQIASECFMPLGYGGGIKSREEANKLFSIGIEKIIFNTTAYTSPSLISEIAKEVGSQSIVVSIDYKKNFFGIPKLFSHCGATPPALAILEYAKYIQGIGVGEIMLHCVDRDGEMNGYDLNVLKQVASSLEIPVIACGGAGSISHLLEGVKDGNASAVAAGSMFVFHGPLRGVLINYPSQEALKKIFY